MGRILVNTKRGVRERPSRCSSLLCIGILSFGAWVIPGTGFAAESGVLVQLASAALSNAEMAQQTGTGLNLPSPVTNGTLPQQPRVILWDELRHAAPSIIQPDAGTITIRVLP